MPIVIGVSFFPVMGCVFTAITAVTFMTQNLFASVVLAGVAAGALVATAHRCTSRRAQAIVSTCAALFGPPLPTNRWALPDMSSAVSPRRRTPPTRCLP